VGSRPAHVQRAVFENNHQKLSELGKAGARARATKLKIEREGDQLFNERAAARHQQEEDFRSRQANEHICPLELYD
jgi:hypothetical protein